MGLIYTYYDSKKVNLFWAKVLGPKGEDMPVFVFRVQGNTPMSRDRTLNPKPRKP